MSDWDPEGLSRTFRYKAESTERYLKEIGPKIPRQRTYEVIHDMTMAEMVVHMCLYEKTFLNSRESFLAELKRMRGSPAPLREKVYNRTQFDNSYYRVLDGLIEAYTLP